MREEKKNKWHHLLSNKASGKNTNCLVLIFTEKTNKQSFQAITQDETGGKKHIQQLNTTLTLS